MRIVKLSFLKKLLRLCKQRVCILKVFLRGTRYLKGRRHFFVHLPDRVQHDLVAVLLHECLGFFLINLGFLFVALHSCNRRVELIIDRRVPRHHIRKIELHCRVVGSVSLCGKVVAL